MPRYSYGHLSDWVRMLMVPAIILRVLSRSRPLVELDYVCVGVLALILVAVVRRVANGAETD